MDLKAIMDNLAVGITSGVFSSIIVSVIFYILLDYQNEIKMAKDMTYPLWGLNVLSLTIDVPKNFEVKDVAKKYFTEANINFERFEPWKFKYELHNIMVNIYELLIDGKSHHDIETGNIKDLCVSFDKELQKLDSCERYFASGFFRRIINNKIIISLMIIFLIVISIAIIS